MLNKIFSIKNEKDTYKTHYILTILGIKIKFHYVQPSQNTIYTIKKDKKIKIKKLPKNISIIGNGINNEIFIKDIIPASKKTKHITIRLNGNNNKIKLSSISKFINCEMNFDGDNNSLDINTNNNILNCKFRFISQNSIIKISNPKFIQKIDFFIQGKNNIINIDDNFQMQKGKIYCVYENARIIIGKNCLFSWGVEIQSNDMHSLIDLDTKEIINPGNFVEIGENVWLAKHVFINKNVKLADNISVGARSLVTKSCEENNVVLAGIPAKIIRRNVKRIN